jgi:hypothetical protein
MYSKPIYEFFLRNISKIGIQTKPIKFIYNRSYELMWIIINFQKQNSNKTVPKCSFSNEVFKNILILIFFELV